MSHLTPSAPSAASLRQPTGAGVTPASPALIALAAGVLPCVLAYALATTNESRVMAIVVALVGALVIVARPFWGLIFFLGLLYTRPEESIPALAGMRLPLMISVLTLVAMVFQNLLARRPLVKSPLNGMALGFGIAVVLSSLPYGNTGQAAQDIAKLVILVFLVVNLASTPERYRALTLSLLVFTGYLAAYSIYLYFTGQALQQHDIERSKGTGIFGDPNDLAGTIVTGFALALTRVRDARSGGRLLYGGLSVLMLWAIFLTNSRGGMLALLLVVGSYFLFTARNKALGAGIGAVVMALFLAFGPSRMTSFDSSEESANSRLHFWVAGVEMLKGNPVLGAGYGNFVENNDGMVAHNSFVHCFGETGLVGYFFWMGLLYYCYRPNLVPKGDGPAVADGGEAAAFPRDTGTLLRADSTSTPPRDATPAADEAGAWSDLFGARLALAGFLAAAFWVSRTYIPVLYITLCLPVVQQIARSGRTEGYTPLGPERTRDWKRILLIALASIVFIYVYALKSR